MLDLGTLVAKIKVEDGQAMTTLKGFESKADASATGIGGKFNKLGGMVKTALVGAAIAGAAALGAAVIKISKDAYKAYAQFEQLEGGVQKIFGGDAAKTVMKNAEAAYKTAGISANKYMDLTTSFSASLLQSLGGNANEAAKVADMAIKDMSDNANVYGTSLESIQDTYQGFAKQNYTMLDNLKLGYGGTKTEMERLLADAGKLTGKKYDIQNLNDVYEAIHAIQKEQKITGTTAKEAGNTVEGSFNMMKASYENFVTTLGSGDKTQVQKAVNNMVNSIGTFAKNALPLLGNILKGLVAAIPIAYEKYMNTVSSDKFKNGATKLTKSLLLALLKKLPMLLTMGPKLMKLGAEMVIAIGKGILQAAVTALQKPLKKVTDTILKLKDNFLKIVNALKEAWDGLKLKAKQAKLTLAGKAKEAVDKFKGAWKNLKTATKNFFVKLLGGGLAALEKFKKIWNGFKNLSKTFKVSLKTVITGLKGVPKKIKEWLGFRNGLDFVPYDEYPAMLHYGEMVLSRGEANRYRKMVQSAEAGAVTAASNSPIYTNITVELDGQVVARKTAKFMNKEINTLNKMNGRKAGVI